METKVLWIENGKREFSHFQVAILSDGNRLIRCVSPGCDQSWHLRGSPAMTSTPARILEIGDTVEIDGDEDEDEYTE